MEPGIIVIEVLILVGVVPYLVGSMIRHIVVEKRLTEIGAR
jgi:hypothetical protein